MNNHLRNAYSHQYYKVLDGLEVRIWDINPNTGKYSLDPEIWSIASLKKISNELMYNAIGIIHAMILFSINNLKIGIARKWIPRLDDIDLLFEELKPSFKHKAKLLGLHTLTFEVNYNTLFIKLKTRLEGINQDEKIFMGGEGWSSAHVVPVEYVEKPAIPLLANTVLEYQYNLSKYNEINIELTGKDDNREYHIELDPKQLLNNDLTAMELAETWIKDNPELDSIRTWLRIEKGIVNLGTQYH